MRQIVLAIADQKPVRELLTVGPGRPLAERFVAGETLEAALEVTRDLLASGFLVSLNYLGEAVASLEEAQEAAGVYADILSALAAAKLSVHLSLKPTQLGLGLDPDRCFALASEILATAERQQVFVRLDMEQSSHVDATLALWRRLRANHENVGVVLQTLLRRTERDLLTLTTQGAPIRLVKGAYAEPDSVAFPDKRDVDTNYKRLTVPLLRSSRAFGRRAAWLPPIAALATHDDRLIDHTLRVATGLGLTPDLYEFQMLYGVRRQRQRDLLAAGHAVRLYVPWGPNWYRYLTRRLAERPANLLFLARHLLPEG
ncbi:MAG: proline dehydrogenase family protein [Chloroflexi bacterium]|nr:proline dehydrogenase family protein [Chloroflexota bacterium]